MKTNTQEQTKKLNKLIQKFIQARKGNNEFYLNLAYTNLKRFTKKSDLEIEAMFNTLIKERNHEIENNSRS